MKKDDFKKSLDNINPDADMGNRLKTQISKINMSAKSDRQMLLVITTFCFVFAIIFGVRLLSLQPSDSTILSPKTTENTVSQSKQISAFIMVANAANGEKTETATIYETLELNEEYPCEIYLKVKDISGLSEEEKTKLIQEMNNDVFKKHSSDSMFKRGHVQICTTEKIILSQCGLNEFKFDLEHTENIKTVNAKNTSKYGQVVFNSGRPTFDTPPHGNDITVNGEEFDCEKSSFYWDHTEEMEKVFDKNINTAFSTFNDSITFTVEYKDGSKAIGIVELVFDDLGNAITMCKSYDYTS
ncbi:MAG: hypothetical protein IJZ57_10550 [Clostridia bacterium]|nr:hypothetical protein [Clostridia bacterium]